MAAAQIESQRALQLPKTATPSSYFVCQDAALQHLAHTTPSMPVGLLACQRDPLLRSLVTTIHSAKKVPENTAAAAGKTKKTKSAAEQSGSLAIPTAEKWQVILKDTVLFPEGGGQPWDTGRLCIPNNTVTGDKKIELPVSSAIRRNLDALHFVEIPAQLGISGQELLQPGMSVRVEVDWDRREDHMQQHTGQHLLSACLDALQPTIETLGWSLSVWPQPCYVELPRAPTPQELRDVEEKMADLIAGNRPIRVSVEEMKEGKQAPSSIPDDYAAGKQEHGSSGADQAVNSQGVIRTITIDGIDENPCCGTHWPSLSFLQYVHVHPTTTKIRGSNFRLYFSVGRRALHNLTEAFDIATNLGRTLDAPRSDLEARMEQMIGREKAARKRETRLRDEVALQMAETILAEANGETPSNSTSTRNLFKQRRSEIEGAYGLRAHSKADGDGHRCAVVLHRDDADLELLASVARQIEQIYKNVGHGAVPQILLLCLSSGTTAPAAPLVLSTSTESLLLVAFAVMEPVQEAAAQPQGKKGGKATSMTDALVAKAGNELRQAFGTRLKGGGKGRWQGKLVADAAASNQSVRWEKEDAQRRFEAVKAALEA